MRHRTTIHTATAYARIGWRPEAPVLPLPQRQVQGMLALAVGHRSGGDT
jgi:hypothetical protein